MKVCKDCNLEKSHRDFYGFQGECKDCTKKRVRLREKKLIEQDPNWIEKERTRHREKYHRLGYKDKHKPTYEMKKKAITKHKKKFPEKYKAKSYTNNLKTKIKGNNLHHWSYNKEHYKDVIELSIEEHNKLHRFLKYDKETFMYKTLNGELLDTKEKHIEYYNSIKKLN